MSLLYNIYLEIDDLHLYIYLYRTVFCPLLSVFRRVFYVTMCLFLLSSTVLCLWIEIGSVYHFVICNISRIMLILDISILLKDVTRCKALQIKKIACSSAVGFYFESKKKWYESTSSISNFHLVVRVKARTCISSTKADVFSFCIIQ